MTEVRAFSRSSLVFIFVTVALDAIGLGIIIPVLPDLLQEVMDVDVGGAARWGGLLATSYAITQFFFGPMLGSLSDRFGRRPVLLLGLVFLCIDYLIMGFAASIWWLLIGRLLAGAAGSTYVTANAVIADISPPETRAANFGMVGAAFGIGFILGPVIGGLLGELGTRAPFFAAAALAAVNFLFGYFVLRETLTDTNRREFSWVKSNPFAALLMVKRFPALGWIFLGLFLFDIGHFVYPAIWAYWGKETLDWSAFDIGLSLAAVGLGFALVQGWLIRLVMPRFGETRTAVFAFAVTILSLLAFGFIETTWMVYAILPFTALGALLTPALSGILSNAVPEDEQGMLQGIISGMMAIATIISPLLMTGLFYHYTSGETIRLPGAPFLLAALLCVLALVAFLRGVGKAGSVDNAR